MSTQMSTQEFAGNVFSVVSGQAMQVGECPLWHADEQTLYWVDIDAFTVHAKDMRDGVQRAWRMPAEPSALAVNANGGLVVAMRSGFAHLDTASGDITPIADAPFDTATTRFNDGRVDAAGRFWVGTLFEPRNAQAAEMYVLDKGQVRLAWSGGMTNSNGLGFSPDNRTMYHADTAAHRIDRYSFDLERGEASDAQCFQQFASDKKAADYGGRPDGAAVDCEGAYWCAMFEGARLLRFSPQGELLREVKLPLRCPTMVAFGGPDLRTLFITSASHGRSEAELAQYPLSGRVLSLQVEVAGREEPRYA